MIVYTIQCCQVHLRNLAHARAARQLSVFVHELMGTVMSFSNSGLLSLTDLQGRSFWQYPHGASVLVLPLSSPHSGQICSSI